MMVLADSLDCEFATTLVQNREQPRPSNIDCVKPTYNKRQTEPPQLTYPPILLRHISCSEAQYTSTSTAEELYHSPTIRRRNPGFISGNLESQCFTDNLSKPAQARR